MRRCIEGGGQVDQVDALDATEIEIARDDRAPSALSGGGDPEIVVADVPAVSQALGAQARTRVDDVWVKREPEVGTDDRFGSIDALLAPPVGPVTRSEFGQRDDADSENRAIKPPPDLIRPTLHNGPILGVVRALHDAHERRVPDDLLGCDFSAPSRLVKDERQVPTARIVIYPLGILEGGEPLGPRDSLLSLESRRRNTFLGEKRRLLERRQWLDLL